MDIINKVITIGLIFALVVLGPLSISFITQDMLMKQGILNEVTQFVDVTTDKKSVLSSDLDDLYIGINAYGGTFDVTVKRLVRVATKHNNPDTGVLEVHTNYYVADGLEELNAGDVVQVEVEEIGVARTTRMLWSILGLDLGRFEFSLAGHVR